MNGTSENNEHTHDVPVLGGVVAAVHDGVDGDLVTWFTQHEQGDYTESEGQVLRDILTLPQNLQHKPNRAQNSVLTLIQDLYSVQKSEEWTSAVWAGWHFACLHAQYLDSAQECSMKQLFFKFKLDFGWWGGIRFRARFSEIKVLSLPPPQNLCQKLRNTARLKLDFLCQDCCFCFRFFVLP